MRVTVRRTAGWRRAYAVAAGFLSAGSSVGWTAAATAQVQIPAECLTVTGEATSFDRAFVDLMRAHDVPGASLAVVGDGGIRVVRGYGCAELASRRRMDEETPIRIASVSKVFVATAAVQLADAAKVDVRESVNAYLGDLEIPDLFGHPITLHDLLTHTAGLEERVVGYAARRPEDVQPLGGFLARRLPAQGWPAGLHTGYSNFGYALAAHVLEEVEKKDFAEIVGERILEPLGMERTGYAETMGIAADPSSAVGYRCEPDACTPVAADYRSAYPAGGMVSTASDMARFIEASLGLGPAAGFLSEAAANELRRQQFTHHSALPGISYAYAESWLGPARSLVHAGGSPGFSSLLVLVPEQRSGFFVAVNGGSSAFGAAVRDLIAATYLVGDNAQPADPDGVGAVSSFVSAGPSASTGPGASAAPSVSPGSSGSAGPTSVSGPAVITGSYRYTRMARRTIENLPSMFVGQLHVTAAAGDTVTVTGLGDGDGAYVPIADDVWQRVGGSERLAVRREARGTVTHLFGPISFFGGTFPGAFERLAWYDSPGVVNEALSILVVPLLLMTAWAVWGGVVAVLRRLRRRPRSLAQSPRLPVLCGSLLAVLLVVFGFGFIAPTVRAAESGGGEIVYGMPPGMALLGQLPWVLAALVAVLGYWTLRGWRGRWWGVFGRLCMTGVVLAGALALLFLAHWSYLPVRY